MRGKLRSAKESALTDGITPAGAGKTKKVYNFLEGLTDHPRRCGENAHAATALSVPAGSPPQVRGKPVILYFGAIQRQDHPRRCGENYRGFVRGCTAVGSPPQVRGKPSDRTQAVIRPGITPAGAGKTRSLANTDLSLTDHPRRCGENCRKNACGTQFRGSPPQVRGKPLHLCGGSNPHGITPAGAGKTRQPQVPKSGGWDHPRRCGENW